MAEPRRKPLSHQIRADIWDASGGTCHYCKSALHPLRNFHVDHVVPVSRGGTNDPVNLVAACRDCNLRKNAQPVDLFLSASKRRAFYERIPKLKKTSRLASTIPRREMDTVRGAAERLGIAESTIRGWIEGGELCFYKVGVGGRVYLDAVAELTNAA